MVKFRKRKNHPTFARMNYGRTKRSRIGKAWRHPRGHDNKQKVAKAYVPALPAIGYGQPRATRHMHPSGVRTTLVRNIAQAMTAKEAIIIAAGIGRRKHDAILKIAKEKKLKVMNS
ncbi:50S ribosomal protein L32e [Candidatus Burarchaeum australiense]|nr:50S ribosomal protein L32e [Candidatus Burarchaeum australiense]